MENHTRRRVLKGARHRGLLIAAAVGIAAGCGPAIQESPPPRVSGSILTYLAASSAILVGVVDDVKEAGWIHSSKYGGQPVQLCSVKVTVENVLKGPVSPGSMTLYYFAKRGNMGGLDRMNFLPGYRLIFYLRRESGEWRTACDYYEMCVGRVLTGRHPTLKRNANLKPTSPARLLPMSALRRWRGLRLIQTLQPRRRAAASRSSPRRDRS